MIRIILRLERLVKLALIKPLACFHHYNKYAIVKPNTYACISFGISLFKSYQRIYSAFCRQSPSNISRQEPTRIFYTQSKKVTQALHLSTGLIQSKYTIHVTTVSTTNFVLIQFRCSLCISKRAQAWILRSKVVLLKRLQLGP